MNTLKILAENFDTNEETKRVLRSYGKRYDKKPKTFSVSILADFECFSKGIVPEDLQRAYSAYRKRGVIFDDVIRYLKIVKEVTSELQR